MGGQRREEGRTESRTLEDQHGEVIPTPTQHKLPTNEVTQRGKCF